MAGKHKMEIRRQAQLLRLGQLRERYGIPLCSATLRKLAADPASGFPQAIRLGHSRILLFDEAAVLAFLKARGVVVDAEPLTGSDA